MQNNKMLRSLFQGKKIIRVAGAHNALGAKLVERAGFDAVWASGLEISTSHCVPDANILSMTDFLAAASSMNEAVSIPVIADCDTGFGNSNNVMHMVKKYESAGIAAVCIEDKHFPKVNSFISGRQELAPVSEFVGKILAAKNAQTCKDFMVIGRIEALIAGWGMEEAFRRANAYADAGADAILIHSKSKTANEIKEFAKNWKNRLPLVAIPTTYYSVKAQELEKIGVKMVIYANQGIRASIRAMQETFARIRKDDNTAGIEENITPMQEVFELQGMPKMKERELIYSAPKEENIVAVIPVAGDHLEEYSMKEISQDISIAMLDINGKPLLQRQVETLNRCKVYDIRVIGGYKREKITVEGIKTIANDQYKNSGILYSIMCALKDIDNPALIIYGDILFDNFLVSKALSKAADILMVVDTTYDDKRMAGKKKTELVVADVKIGDKKRALHSDSLYAVKKAGSAIKKGATNLEFCGVLFLSRKGVNTVKEAYAKRQQDFYKISLINFLQELINSGHTVNCLDVNSGWMEINSLQDYKLACSIFR